MTTNTNTAGQSAAIQHVRNGLLADIARRNEIIRQHAEAAAQLRADNVTDAMHAEVAAALIAQIEADTLAAAWAPSTDIAAAALVAEHVPEVEDMPEPLVSFPTVGGAVVRVADYPHQPRAFATICTGCGPQGLHTYLPELRDTAWRIAIDDACSHAAACAKEAHR